jgi:aspartate 1-decarboxylase
VPGRERGTASCQAGRASRRTLSRGSAGEVCVNGASAHLVKIDDLVIVCAYTELNDADCRGFEPIRVFVDQRNRMCRITQNQRAGLPHGSADHSGRSL